MREYKFLFLSSEVFLFKAGMLSGSISAYKITKERRGKAFSIGVGAVSGAGMGAVIGSIVPGIGTAIGAGIGFILGGYPDLK